MFGEIAPKIKNPTSLLSASQAVITDANMRFSSLPYSSTNTVSSLVQRDSSGNFSAGTITATLSGTSTNANNIATTQVSNNASYFPILVSSSTNSNQVPDLATGLTYNPSTNILSTTGLNLSGLSASLPLFTDASKNLTTSGTVPVNQGGTGQTTYTNGQLLIGNTTGNTLSLSTLTGTTNQITVINGGGSITLSTPQNINSTATVSFSTVTLSGASALTITNNSAPIRTENAAFWQTKNTSGTYESWLCPRFNDNKLYMDIGSAGGIFRQNGGSTNWMSVDTSGNVTFPTGNVIFSTATTGLQLTHAAVSGGTANSTLVTGVVLSSGASGTINNSAITTSHIGFAVPTTRSGTLAGSYAVTCSAGSFSVAGGALDNSTLAVLFIKSL